jgi:hypothetical protein
MYTAKAVQIKIHIKNDNGKTMCSMDDRLKDEKICMNGWKGGKIYVKSLFLF